MELPAIQAFIKQTRRTSENVKWAQAKKFLLTAHTDGFSLGKTHGMLLGSQIERSLMIQQG
jgi:hypothetical protein